MRLDRDGASGAQLTYCTNVHPGESAEELLGLLAQHVTAVKAKVAPDEPFGVGLRVSARAASELRGPGRGDALRALLEREGLYVFTINGFPYGPFHGSPVKERVYLPDWRAPERLRYTQELAELLASLLPEGGTGSISSVPGAFRPAVRGRDDEQAIADNVLACAASMHRLAERTGRSVALALEPEPACYLETTSEALAFFERFIHSERGLTRFAELTGVARVQARDVLDRHLGLCLDACHAAVEFEDPRSCIASLTAAGVAVKKLQVSAGLRIERVDAAMCEALAAYAADPVYLHQVVERRADGTLARYLDLPQALCDGVRDGSAEWRVHFHVPIFLSRLRHFGSTQRFVSELLALQRERPFTRELEVETYTFDVLPDEVRPQSVHDAIAAELRFCLDALT